MTKWAGFCAEATRSAGFPWFYLDEIELAMASFWRGEIDEAIETLRRAAASDPKVGGFGGMASAFLCYLGAYGSDPQLLSLASAVSVPLFGEVGSYAKVVSLLCLVEALSVTGQTERVKPLRPLVQQLFAQGIDGIALFYSPSLPRRAAGICASQDGDWPAAERHFEQALVQAHALPHRVEQPETRRWYARMLMERGAPGDRDKARQLLTEARKLYRTIGMPRHVAMVEEMIEGDAVHHG